MSWWELLPYVSTGLGLLGALWGFYRRVLQPALRELAAIHDLAEQQLRANGGASLVDRVADTQRRVAALEGEVRKNAHRLDRVEGVVFDSEVQP